LIPTVQPPPKKKNLASWAATFLLLTAVAAAMVYLDIRPAYLFDGVQNLRQLGQDAFPPQLDLLPVALAAIVETLAIALLGTFFGLLLALPLGIAGARTLSPRWLFVPVRLFCAGIRTLPALLWAVLFVVLVGFRPFAGVLAMMMYTVGHLSKLQYESFEGLAPEPLEAARATGAGFLQTARFVVLPEASNQLVSQVLYMFEYNVRASAIVGFVGAGGIGFYIHRYLQMMQYDGVVTLLAVVFVMLVVIDGLSLKARERFITTLPGQR
jgi:phosphonate transport system permease protein